MLNHTNGTVELSILLIQWSATSLLLACTEELSATVRPVLCYPTNDIPGQVAEYIDDSDSTISTFEWRLCFIVKQKCASGCGPRSPEIALHLHVLHSRPLYPIHLGVGFSLSTPYIIRKLLPKAVIKDIWLGVKLPFTFNPASPTRKELLKNGCLG